MMKFSWWSWLWRLSWSSWSSHVQVPSCPASVAPSHQSWSIPSIARFSSWNHCNWISFHNLTFVNVKPSRWWTAAAVRWKCSGDPLLEIWKTLQVVFSLIGFKQNIFIITLRGVHVSEWWKSRDRYPGFDNSCEPPARCSLAFHQREGSRVGPPDYKE